MGLTVSNPDQFVRAIAVEFIKDNAGKFTDEQLRHIMSICETELVNRMAADAGYNDPDEHTPD